MRIILYQKVVQLGGTFTFDYNYARTFGDKHEIIYMYEAGSEPLLAKMRNHATLLQNKGLPVEGDICVYSSIGHATHEIRARKFMQVLHADLHAWNVTYEPRGIDVHVAVGQSVADSAKEHHGIDAIVIPNLMPEPQLDQVLRLVTASRIERGKGFERIIKLAKALRKAGKAFTWEIYGRGSHSYLNELKYELSYTPEVVFMGERYNVQSYMATADYVVQLSDNEGFCYSIYEALQIGVPVIVTDWAGVRDVVKDGENGYILDMELGNLRPDMFYGPKVLPNPSLLPPTVRNSVQLWEEQLRF